jgi:hypothetical protein
MLFCPLVRVSECVVEWWSDCLLGDERAAASRRVSGRVAAAPVEREKGQEGRGGGGRHCADERRETHTTNTQAEAGEESLGSQTAITERLGRRLQDEQQRLQQNVCTNKKVLMQSMLSYRLFASTFKVHGDTCN